MAALDRTTERRVAPRAAQVVGDLWAVALTIVLCRPLLFGSPSGYGLARDMVFTPREPLSAEAIGMGATPPRAVPLDAIVGLATHVVDGTWVGRFLVAGVVLLAGCGMHRVVPDLSVPGRLVAAGAAVWNPFVVERLALGQWALLSAYAALPWLIRAVVRHRAETGPGRTGLGTVAPVLGWGAVAALTPTGGLIALVTTAVLAIGSRGRSLAALLTVAAVTQLPWLLPALLSPATTSSDPAGVAAFAARAERPGGPLPSLLGLGGVWDATSTPPSRAGVLGYLGTVAVVLALLAGTRPLLRRCGRTLVVRLATLAAGGFLVAAASSLPGGDAVLRWVVRSAPGGGIVRDSQKWLLPAVVLVVMCAAVATDRLAAAARGRAEVVVLVAVAAASVPLLLLPDAAPTTGRTLTPVEYPADFAAVRRIVDGTGALVTLPLQAYRVFPWGRPTSVADPASRWFDTPVIVDDRLVVGDVRLAGEDVRAARIVHGLASGTPLATVLRDERVRWALVYRVTTRSTTRGLVLVRRGVWLDLYRVPGVPVSARPVPVASGAAVSVVVVADVALLVAVSGAVGATLWRARGRGSAEVRC